jgi:hypothetical protein
MTNPTSNFGWQMPTSTDLVTDLPADFAVFGQAVDTSMSDLLGGTTGQVLKKNSNTNMDFVWSADAAGMTNPMTTTGDMVYSSSGSTPARLGVGTTGQVVTVAGGVPTWATPASTYVGAFAYSNASQSIANATNTAIALQAENFDTNSFHDDTTNNSRMTIPAGKGGKYLVQGALLWQNGTSGARTLGFFKNGSQVALWDVTPVSATTWSFACSMAMDLVATDYVELYAVQQSGGAVNVYGSNIGNGTSTFFSVSLLGA